MNRHGFRCCSVALLLHWLFTKMTRFLLNSHPVWGGMGLDPQAIGYDGMSQMQPLRHRAWRKGKCGSHGEEGFGCGWVAFRQVKWGTRGNKKFCTRCCSTLRLRNTALQAINTGQTLVRPWWSGSCGREGRGFLLVSGWEDQQDRQKPGLGALKEDPGRHFAASQPVCDLCNQLPAPTHLDSCKG